MNTLPWTISILIIFAFLSVQFFSTMQNNDLTKDVILSAKKMLHEVEKEKSIHHLNNIVRGKLPKKNVKKSEKKNPYQSPRLTNYGNESSKVNIYKAFEGNEFEKNQFEKILFYYYSNAPFLTKKNELHALTDALIKKGQKLLKAQQKITFDSIIPDDQNLQELYFHIRKGSKNFSYENLEYFPALEKVFSLDEKQKDTFLFFQDLPLPTIEAIFSPNFAQAIYEDEKRRYEEKEKKISQDELQTLFSENGIDLSWFDKMNLSQKPMRKKQIHVKEKSKDFGFDIEIH